MPLGWPCALFGDPHDVGHAFLDQNVSRRRCVHLKTGMPVGSIGGAYRMCSCPATPWVVLALESYLALSFTRCLAIQRFRSNSLGTPS